MCSSRRLHEDDVVRTRAVENDIERFVLVEAPANALTGHAGGERTVRDRARTFSDCDEAVESELRGYTADLFVRGP
jgi:hypothetical protein